MDDELTAKTTKFTSLENLYLYSRWLNMLSVNIFIKILNEVHLLPIRKLYGPAYNDSNLKITDCSIRITLCLDFYVRMLGQR